VMSSQAAKKNQEEMKETLVFSLRMISFVTIPASVGLVVLAQPIVQVLFQHGRFMAADTERTAFALIFYAIGIFFIAGIRIMVPAFYAVQDTKTPVRCAFVSLIINIVGNLILMHPLKQGGIALATSIAAAVNFVQLLIYYQKRFGRLHWEELNDGLLRIGIQTVALGVACPVFLKLFRLNEQQHVTGQALVLFGTIGLSILIYLGIALLLKSKELGTLRNVLFRNAPADENS
jgi:putative peptidoglycan lipid II flippase